MESVAIIGGTGDLGFGLALRLAKAGISIRVGSRKREKAERAAMEAKQILGDDVDVSGFENSKAASGSSVVILSVPFEGVEEIIESIGPSLSENCIVVSCIVPLGVDVGGFSSAAEYVASKLPAGVRVVAAYHTVSAEKLRNLEKPVGCDTIITGDDKRAKKRIAELTYLIEGLRPVDGGGLKNTSISENLTRLLIQLNKKYKITNAGIRFTELGDDMVRKKWEEI